MAELQPRKCSILLTIGKIPRLTKKMALGACKFVVESKIPDYSRSSWIGRVNLGLAVEKSFWLVEIRGLGYVRRDERIILVKHRDTIHLNGEQHRNAIFLQSTSQGDGV